MRNKFPVLTVKKLLKSVSIYGSCRKNKTGVPFFGTPCIASCNIGLNFLICSTTRITMVRVKNYETKCKFVKVMAGIGAYSRLFSDTVYIYTKYF